MVSFFRTLFSSVGFLIIAYLLIGIFFNTAPPHLPSGSGSSIGLNTIIHSWVQYIISVMFWPLSLWSPTFTLGKWTPL